MLKAIAEYFRGEEVQLYHGIIGIKVNKVGEEEIDLKTEDEIENIKLKEGIVYVHNSVPLLVQGVNVKYVLPKPLKLLKIGVPKSVDNPDQVPMDYITFFDKDYILIGIDLTDNFDKPFVVLEFEEGFTKVILKDEFARAVPVQVKSVKEKKGKTKKTKRKKKSAKRSSGKQKAKGKSARKSRRV